MQSLSYNNSILSFPMEEVKRIFSEAKEEISPKLSKEEKINRLGQLEKRITILFETLSPVIEKNHSFENFAARFSVSYPQLKPLISDLFLHLNSHEGMIDFHLNTLNNPSDLESELTFLCEKLPKIIETGILLIDKIEKTFSASDEKMKLAYRIFVIAFNINNYKKFASFFCNSPLFAIEAAKFAAAQEYERLSYCIQNYGIKNQKGLIEIAQTSATQDGFWTSMYIQNYGIEDEKGLIEIAKIAAAQKINRTFHIQEYGIKDQQALFAIFLISIGSSQEKAFEALKKYNFSEDLKSKIMDSFDLLSKAEVDFSKVYELLFSFSISHEWLSLENILEKIRTKNPHIQKTVLFWLTQLLGHFANEKISSEHFKFLKDAGFLEAALTYTDPKMRYPLTSAMVAVVENEVSRECVSSLFKFKHPPHAKVPVLLLSLLHRQGVDRDTCCLLFKTASQNTFKQGKNLRVFVNAIHSILDSKELNAIDKQYLLSQGSQNIIPSLYAISAIKDLNPSLTASSFLKVLIVKNLRLLGEKSQIASH
ncbi:MAG: hypothetical protein H0W50_10150 [Parachlamydiaceae bacterium]|nr:hypothetical protein [Parachlamydiaceae bacterium]